MVGGHVRRRQVLGPGQRAEPAHKPPARQRVRALRLRAGDERGREALDEVGGRRNELAADGLARGRARVTHHDLEDLVDLELPLEPPRHGHPATSRRSCATGTRSSRPTVLCVQ